MLPIPVRAIASMVVLLCFTPVFAQTAAENKQAQLFQNQAIVLESRKEYRGASELMTKALELTPKNDAFLAYTAKIQFLTGNVKEGVSFGRQALDLKPSNPTYLGLVMRGAFAGKDYDTAKDI